MRPITLAAAVLNTVPLAWDHNRMLAVQAIRSARARGAGLLCLPELCLSGYGCEDAFHAVGVQQAAWDALRQLLPETTGIAVSVGLPVAWRNALFNCAALVVDGRVVGLHAKHFLAGDGIHYEPRWFKPWPTGTQVGFEHDGERIPLGDLVVDLGGVRVGFEICEDAWVANRPGAELARLGVDVILNPSASHFAFGKSAVRERFVAEGSRAFGVAYVYANLVGNEAGRVIYDGGALIAAGGRIVAQGPRFAFRDCVVTAATVDIDTVRTAQLRTASFTPSFAPDRWVQAGFTWPAATTAVEADDLPSPFEAVPARKEEEFARAVALGLFDYLRKSRATGFALSLSGGADSTAVALLVALAERFAWDELGHAQACLKLPHLPALHDAEERYARMARLLTTAYQATRNSSDTTREAAAAVAAAVGAHHLEIDVDPVFDHYLAIGGAALGRLLDWNDDDIALQNLQARVRAPGIWLLANVRGQLLLTTSNRTEAAVGYATMDGDTAGGLAPIAGIDKAFLRHWLEWMEQEGPHGVGAWPALAAVTAQRSTPELRPPESGQRSEDDLMPFPVLDAIERSAIRDKRLPVECWHAARAAFPAEDPARLAQWVERFFTLWCRNQWKRERYAPSFHLDDENLDPKTWCRFPILSGGFASELADLRQQAAKLAPR